MVNTEFTYCGGILSCEDAPLTEIAEAYGTPAYVYSKRAILTRFQAYEQALAGIPHRVCFSVKSNSNLAVLRSLAREGASFDIVSGGELFRVLAAGGDPSGIVFSGVGKTDAEIRYAVESGIHSFNCESEAEIGRISEIAKSADRQVSIAIRVNPDVDAATHPYISTGLHEHKFGIEIHRAEELYLRAMHMPGIVADGVSCHIGSQLLDVGPLLEAAEKMLELISRLRGKGLRIRTLDLGGGLGVGYRRTESGACVRNFIAALRERIAPFDLTLMLEPGRSIAAEAGILLVRVLLVKQNGAKRFIIVDAAMNDLIRPALYQAHHEILAVEQIRESGRVIADVVGPVCETGDFFARAREVADVRAGDLLAIATTGAYGFVLASNYNSRPRPCELLIDGGQVHLVRRRETYDDLVRGEIANSCSSG